MSSSVNSDEFEFDKSSNQYDLMKSFKYKSRSKLSWAIIVERLVEKYENPYVKEVFIRLDIMKNSPKQQ